MLNFALAREPEKNRGKNIFTYLFQPVIVTSRQIDVHTYVILRASVGSLTSLPLPSSVRLPLRCGSQGSVGAFGFLEQSDKKIILVDLVRFRAVAIDISAVSCGDSA